MAVRGITQEQLQKINAMYLAQGKKAAKELEKSIRFNNKMRKEMEKRGLAWEEE